MKKNTGEEFEKLAESIFRKLVKNPQFESVERNVWIDGIDGKRQVDVLIKAEVVGINIITVIECKDYNTKISVGKIDEFHSKLMDIKANKGIFISKKGFSSTSTKKAKRLGITLCTAHEALKPSWNIEFDIPLIVELLQPKYDIKYNLTVDAGDKVSRPFVVNDIDIIDLIFKKWSNRELNIKNRKGGQPVSFDELKPPYYLRLVNKGNVKRSITDLNIDLEIISKCYFIPLSEVQNTQLLNNISENKLTVFLNIKSVFEISNEFKEIKCKDAQRLVGANLKLLITPIPKDNI